MSVGNEFISYRTMAKLNAVRPNVRRKGEIHFNIQTLARTILKIDDAAAAESSFFASLMSNKINVFLDYGSLRLSFSTDDFHPFKWTMIKIWCCVCVLLAKRKKINFD